MILKSISLQNFRSYQKKEFDFSDDLVLIIGPNAVGKTNLLEAIYLLATGKSFRAGLTSEMISYGREVGRILARIKSKLGKEELEMVLTSGMVLGEKTRKRKYLVNGASKRMVDFVGKLKAVYFGPEDLEIIVNSPSIRRDWLDTVLFQVDWEYRRASVSYQKGLRQRNRLLEQIKEGKTSKSALFFWDKLLVENGTVITKKREEFIEFINSRPGYFGELVVKYDKSIISPQRLEKYSQEEVASGMTLVGPHRDDFQVGMKNHEGKIRNLHTFGSRGEQRTSVFSLKLAELEFIAKRAEERPILLLDDIFSELDHEHRDHLLDVIPEQQTIMTTTDIHLVDKVYLKKFQVVKLK